MRAVDSCEGGEKKRKGDGGIEAMRVISSYQLRFLSACYLSRCDGLVGGDMVNLCRETERFERGGVLRANEE